MLLYSAILIFLFSLVLYLGNATKRPIVLLLMSYLCLTSLFTLTLHFQFGSPSVKPATLLLIHFSPFYLLISPSLYFYLLHLDPDRRWQKKDLIHIIIPCIQLIGVLPWIFKPWSEKESEIAKLLQDPAYFGQMNTNWLWAPFVYLLIRTYLNLSYVGLLIHWYQKKKSILQGNQKQWIQFLLGLFTIQMIAFGYFNFIFTYRVDLFKQNLIKYTQWYGLTLTTLALVGLFIFQDQAAKKFPKLAKQTPSHPELKDLILHWFQQDQPFREEDFSLQRMSEFLQHPVYKIQQCLKEDFSSTFTELRNQYRVQYAQVLLEDESHRHLKIETIAQMAGFKNRSTFYKVFRDYTGKTPSEFLGKINEE